VRVTTTSATGFFASECAEFGEITQTSGHCAFHGHSR